MKAAAYQGLWSKTGLFLSMNSSQLAVVGELMQLRRLESGQLLFTEGEACTGFFVVLEGQIRLFRTGQRAGGETTLSVVRSGFSFAEAAMFSGGIFPATAEALEATLLAYFPKDPFLALLREDPDLSLKVMEGLAAWHHRLTFQVQQLSGQDAAGRLRRWIEDAAKHAPDGAFHLKVPKKILAAQLGMAPETLSRLLKQLRGQGVIEVAGDRIRLL
ncbi:MAG: Crp/Fnr family transcriptional regulator [Holophagaceae bacterium]|nr:Crp/Fnr family transcriptional regulator [Holophagaceae bacterium]